MKLVSLSIKSYVQLFPCQQNHSLRCNEMMVAKLSLAVDAVKKPTENRSSLAKMTKSQRMVFQFRKVM